MTKTCILGFRMAFQVMLVKFHVIVVGHVAYLTLEVTGNPLQNANNEKIRVIHNTYTPMNIVIDERGSNKERFTEERTRK